MGIINLSVNQFNIWDSKHSMLFFKNTETWVSFNLELWSFEWYLLSWCFVIMVTKDESKANLRETLKTWIVLNLLFIQTTLSSMQSRMPFLGYFKKIDSNSMTVRLIPDKAQSIL